MTQTAALRVIEPPGRPSVADAVFAELHRQILALDLPPGTRLSEVDVAKALGVSRQPVRDAFWRLSKLGFLTIRPQRATTVSNISEEAVMQARFIRSAIEAETVRVFTERATEADMAALEAILEAQRAAVAAQDRALFHELDDRFHREICERGGNGFAWDIIRENKAHMDRVRMLSLSFASQAAFEDHLRVMAAIRAREPDRAMLEMRSHLSRIRSQIQRIRAENAGYFDPLPDSPGD
ncbi:MAG: GntR family transcriptional regulator [Gemmobacter sp.]|uniref:GntR family transcriptional regulator n=1 Tax=Gemmobacter sp. TaxID=1898957 RepID=UPI0039189A80